MDEPSKVYQVGYLLGKLLFGIFCLAAAAGIGWFIGWLLRNPLTIALIAILLSVVGAILVVMELMAPEE